MIKKTWNGKKYYTFQDKCILIVLWLIKWAIIIGIVFGIGFITLQFYVASHPKIVINNVEVEVAAKAPIMDRIAQCESGNRQFDSKTGQVILNANKDGSVDIGVMQINNTRWGIKAQSMGYNLAVEQDNRAMAQWIYANRGTGDWSASSHCWNR